MGKRWCMGTAMITVMAITTTIITITTTTAMAPLALKCQG